ncbi:MAG: hypothetical protein S0880_15855 [Actinomycetota bacterium]|nr:hypothetical protein [Actinomycetota bacterium]
MGEPTFDERDLARARADDAIAGRRRERWLLAQADEESTVDGLVASLAADGRACRLELSNGRSAAGVPDVIGPGCVRVRDRSGATTFVRADAIEAVRTTDTHERLATPDGARTSTPMTLTDVLVELAADRPRVRIATAGGTVLTGELRRAGAEAITLGGDGTERDLIYIRLGSVLEVSLMTSG